MLIYKYNTVLHFLHMSYQKPFSSVSCMNNSFCNCPQCENKCQKCPHMCNNNKNDITMYITEYFQSPPKNTNLSVQDKTETYDDNTNKTETQSFETNKTETYHDNTESKNWLVILVITIIIILAIILAGFLLREFFSMAASVTQ